MSDETLHTGNDEAPQGERKSPFWAAVTRAPKALFDGAFVGGTIGALMAGGAMAIEGWTGVPIATFLSGGAEHAVLSSIGSMAGFTGHFMAAHAVGHAMFDTAVECRAAADKAQQHNDTFAVREAAIEQAMANGLEHELALPISQAVSSSISGHSSMLAEEPLIKSQALRTILDKGQQDAGEMTWAQRMDREAAMRRGGVNADLSI